MAETVRIRGLNETLAALNKINRDVKRDVVWELSEAAKPVARDAQSRLSRYNEISLSTIGPRVVTNGVFVTQRAKKVTGLRPDFGALQMVKGFIPALEDNASQIEARVEYALDALVHASGFN